MLAQRLFQTLAVLVGLAILAALPISALAQDGPEYSGSYALLIGVSEYDDDFWDPSVLPNVQRYLKDMREALSKDFRIVEVVNPKNTDLRNAIGKFLDTYGGRWSDNRLLIYFMGHGHTFFKEDPRNPGSKKYEGYLVSRNDVHVNSPQGERQFRTEAVPMSVVRDLARSIKAKHTLFILDACFSGGAIPAEKKEGEKEASLLSLDAESVVQVPPPESVVRVITSGDASQKVPAKSTFTESFVEAVTMAHVAAAADENGDGDLTGKELGKFLFWEVYRASGTKQTPYTSKLSGEGDFVFRVPRDKP